MFLLKSYDRLAIEGNNYNKLYKFFISLSIVSISFVKFGDRFIKNHFGNRFV